MKTPDLRHWMCLVEAGYNPQNIYLHGGPGQLRGGKLTRYGRDHSDMGALFFTPETPDGWRYALGYAITKPDGGVYRCRLKLTANQIFDFSKPAHRRLAQRHLAPEEFQSWLTSARKNYLDWTAVDDERMEEWGFRGAVFLEREAGHNAFATDVLSIGIFHAEDAEIIDFTPKQELLAKMQP